MNQVALAIYKPIYQALLYLILIIPVMFLVRPKNVDLVYTTGGIVYSLFIMTNVILFFWSSAKWNYFIVSLLTSLSFILLAYLICTLFINTIYKLKGSGESSMVFLMIIYHPFLLLSAMLARWIYLKHF